jgi:hypothetical protein
MNLSKRDIRSIQLANELAKNDLTSQLIEYHKLIDTLIYLNETLKEALSKIFHHMFLQKIVVSFV